MIVPVTITATPKPRGRRVIFFKITTSYSKFANMQTQHSLPVGCNTYTQHRLMDAALAQYFPLDATLTHHACRMQHIRSIACWMQHYGYPEWPHRQYVGLAHPWTRVRAQVAAASLTVCSPYLHRAILGAQGVLLMKVGVRPVNWIYHLYRQ